MFFAPASGSTVSEAQRLIAAHGLRLAVHVPSMSTGSAQTIVQTAPTSAGPWADCTRNDGTAALYVVCSGAPASGVSGIVSEQFVRLRFSLALSDATSIRVTPLVGF